MTHMERKPRGYQMTTRAQSAARTAERLLDAMLERYGRLPYDAIRLEDLASDAGVAVQTVVRRFGGKPGLMLATVEREFGRVAADRAAAMGDSPLATVHALVGFYEDHAALILKMYAEADQVPGLPELAASARAFHVDWCRRAFSDRLGGADEPAAQQRRLAQVVAVCDATTWRILRFDGGLDAEQTERAIVELLSPLLADDQRLVGGAEQGPG